MANVILINDYQQQIMKHSLFEHEKEINLTQQPPEKTDQTLDEFNPALFERYMNFFERECADRFSKQFSAINMAEQFQYHKIKYMPNLPDLSPFKLTLINESIHGEVLAFSARWGPFTLQISLLNVNGSSPLHNNQCKFGTYGNVYNANISGDIFAVKCIPFNKQRVTNCVPLMALKQYFLYKIASVLGIGPEMKNWLGFDIIMHESCIQFSIEKCETIRSFSKNTMLELVQNLHFFHHLQIVHFDIKPENIMYSSSYGKAVFIDFGLSQITNIKIGQRKAVFFRGTLDFSSTQMTQIFYSRQKRHVDIYYNDLYCLQQSACFLFHQSKLKANDRQLDCLSFRLELPSQNTDLMVYLIKYYFFFSKVKQLKKIFKLYQTTINSCFMNCILDFLMEFYPTQELKRFYKNEMLTHKKQGYQYRQLKNIYQQHFSILKTAQPNPEKKNIFKEHYSYLMKNIDSSYEQQVFHEGTLLKMLTSELRDNIPPEYYYRLYIDYVSFSWNRFEVDMSKRLQITQKIIQNGLITVQLQEGSVSSCLNKVKSAILSIFMKILESIKNKRYDKISRQFLISLFYDYLEHIFILNLGFDNKIIEQVEQAYNSQVFKQADKLELILKTVHNNVWLSHRFHICTQSQHNCNYSKYYEIEKWCLEKMNDFRLQADGELRLVSDFLCNLWEKSQTNTFQSVYQSCKVLPKSLLFEFRQEGLKYELKYNEHKYTDDAVNDLYYEIPANLKNRVFHFLFIAHNQYLFQMANAHICQEIEQLIEKNLQCEELMSQFIIPHLSNIILKFNDPDYLYLFMKMLEKIDGESMVFHISSIKFGMSNLFVLGGYQEHCKDLYRQIIRRLSSFQKQLKFKKCLQTVKTGIRHKCISSKQIGDYIEVKMLFHILRNTPYRIDEDFAYFLERFYHNGCKKCSYNIVNTLELEAQNYYYYAFSHQLEKQFCIERFQEAFISSSDKLIAIHKQKSEIEETKHYALINMLHRCTFCGIDPVFEVKYHGISQFYYYLKGNDDISFYLNNSPFYFKLLSVTLNVIYMGVSLMELVVFLKKLAKVLGNYYSDSHFKLLLFSFQMFMKIYQKAIDAKQLLYSLMQEQKWDTKEIDSIKYKTIYYYVLLFYLPDHLTYHAKQSITKYIDYLMPKDKRYIKAHYYRFLIWEKSKHGKKDDRLMPMRKYLFLEKQTIKIMCILNKKEIKIKKKRIVNVFLKTLYMKCLKYGGPFDLNLSSLRDVRLKVKQK